MRCPIVLPVLFLTTLPMAALAQHYENIDAWHPAPELASSPPTDHSPLQSREALASHFGQLDLSHAFPTVETAEGWGEEGGLLDSVALGEICSAEGETAIPYSLIPELMGFPSGFPVLSVQCNETRLIAATLDLTADASADLIFLFHALSGYPAMTTRYLVPPVNLSFGGETHIDDDALSSMPGLEMLFQPGTATTTVFDSIERRVILVINDPDGDNSPDEISELRLDNTGDIHYMLDDTNADGTMDGYRQGHLGGNFTHEDFWPDGSVRSQSVQSVTVDGVRDLVHTFWDETGQISEWQHFIGIENEQGDLFTIFNETLTRWPEGQFHVSHSLYDPPGVYLESWLRLDQDGDGYFENVAHSLPVGEVETIFHEVFDRTVNCDTDQDGRVDRRWQVTQSEIDALSGYYDGVFEEDTNGDGEMDLRHEVPGQIDEGVIINVCDRPNLPTTGL